MAQSITSTRARFLLTTAAFLLLNIQAVRAQGGWGGGGRWGDNNGGDGWNGCGWWDGNDDCDDDDDDGDDGDDNENGTLDPAALGLSTSEINRTTKIITVHAVLASLVWVL